MSAKNATSKKANNANNAKHAMRELEELDSDLASIVKKSLKRFDALYKKLAE